MRTYEHGGDIFAEEKRPIDFSVNINPLGMPGEAAEAAERAVREELTYPDPFCRRLTAALSERYGVLAEHIVCGNGASDLLMRLCSYLEPQKVLVPAPGFSEYRRCAELFGAEVKEFSVLGGAAGPSPLEGIISTAVKDAPDMIFICRPNNPDGSLMSLEEVRKLARFCQKRGILLVCDECFLELAGPEASAPCAGAAEGDTRFESAAKLTEEYGALAVINAFTKTYAMAGLRLGFMFCSDEAVLDGTYAFGSPWSVSAPAQAAGEVCCRERAFLEESRSYIEIQRKRLVSGLERLGLEVFPSEANFLLVRAPQSLTEALAHQTGAAGRSLRELLAFRGIKVRDCRNFSGLDDSYMRLGVRTEEENEALLGALKDILDRAGYAPEDKNG